MNLRTCLKAEWGGGGDGQAPIWRGGSCTYDCAVGTSPDCFERSGNVHVFAEEVFVFGNLGTHTSQENHKWYFSFGRRLLIILGHFLLTPAVCLREARPSVMTFYCVFVASRNLPRRYSTLGLFWAASSHDCVFIASRNLTHRYSALGLFWAASSQDFLSFCCVWDSVFSVWEGPPCSFFAPQFQCRTFVPACAARPPTPWQIGSASRFPPPLCGRFSDDFFLVFVFFWIYAIL